jgi:uncharacterized protein
MENFVGWAPPTAGSVWGVLIMLLVATTATSAETVELKTALLNKAFSENLIRQPRREFQQAPSQSSRSPHVHSIKTGIRWLLLTPVRLHQKILTHQDGTEVCTFSPSCSHYGSEAIRRHGLRGVFMASNRLLRCYAGNHVYYSVYDGASHDPVP